MIARRQRLRVLNDEPIITSLGVLEALESLKRVKVIKRDRLYGELQKCLWEIRELKRDIETQKTHFTQNEQLREEQNREVLLNSTLAPTSVEGIFATTYKVKQAKLASMVELQEIERKEKQLEQLMNNKQAISESFVVAEKDVGKTQYLIDTEVNHEP